MIRLLLAVSLACISPSQGSHKNVRIKAGKATIYYPGDGNCGKWKADGSRFKKTDSHIAHRRLPIGTTGYLCSVKHGLCIRTSVQDRGPFGAMLPCDKDPSEAKGIGNPRLIKYGRACYWWQAQTRLQEGWRYRGEFDLTRPVAKAIRHKAFDQVVFIYTRSNRSRRQAISFSNRKGVPEAYEGSKIGNLLPWM